MLKKIVSLIIICMFSLNTLVLADSGQMLAAWSMFANPQDEQLIKVGILETIKTMEEFESIFTEGFPTDVETSVEDKKLIIRLSSPLKIEGKEEGTMFLCLIDGREYFAYIEPLIGDFGIYDYRIHVYNPEEMQKYIKEERFKDTRLKRLHEDEQEDLVRISLGSETMRNIIEFMDKLEKIFGTKTEDRYGPMTSEIIKFCKGYWIMNAKSGGAYCGIFKVINNENFSAETIDHASNVAIHVKEREDETEVELAILHEIFAKLGIPAIINDNPELMSVLRTEYTNWKNGSEFYPEKIRDKIAMLSGWRIELEKARFVDMDTLRNRDYSTPKIDIPHHLLDEEDITPDVLAPFQSSGNDFYHDRSEIAYGSLPAQGAECLRAYLNGEEYDQQTFNDELYIRMVGKVLDKCISPNGTAYILFGTEHSTLILWTIENEYTTIKKEVISKGYANQINPTVIRAGSISANADGTIVIATLDNDWMARIYCNGRLVNAVDMPVGGLIETKIVDDQVTVVVAGDSPVNRGFVWFLRFNISDFESTLTTTAKEFRAGARPINFQEIQISDSGKIICKGREIESEERECIWEIDDEDQIIRYGSIKLSHDKIAEAVHMKDLEYNPHLKRKNILCHIIIDDVIPQGQKQMMQEIEQEMRNEEYNEKLIRLTVKDPDNIADEVRLEMERISTQYGEEYNVEFDVACSRLEDVEKIKEALKINVAAFEKLEETDILAYLEGMMLVLRVLRKGEIDTLKEVFCMLSEQELPAFLKGINNIDEFMKKAQFSLPKAGVEDYSQRKMVNDLIKKLILSAA